MTLEKAINICRATEASKEQIRSLGDGKPNNIDALKKKSFKKTWKSKSDRDRTQENKHERIFKGKNDKNCGNCGRKHPPKACFAYGKRCNRCQKLGHFQSYCRSKPVEELPYFSDYKSTRCISRPLFFSCKMMIFSDTLSISRLPQSLLFTYNCMNSYKIIDHIKSDKTKSKTLPV